MSRILRESFDAGGPGKGNDLGVKQGGGSSSREARDEDAHKSWERAGSFLQCFRRMRMHP